MHLRELRATLAKIVLAGAPGCVQASTDCYDHFDKTAKTVADVLRMPGAATIMKAPPPENFPGWDAIRDMDLTEAAGPGGRAGEVQARGGRSRRNQAARITLA